MLQVASRTRYTVSANLYNVAILNVVVILFSSKAHATWWLLGTDLNVAPTDSKSEMSDMAPGYKLHVNNCSSFAFLSDKQMHMCKKSERVLDTISSGAKLGIDECQHQLQSHRWNCSISRETENVFGRVLDIRSREKAFVHAISSASLAYEVTKSCAKGDLQDCSCDENVRSRNTKGKWQWGGCSEDVKYGSLFSKVFADSIEDKSSPDGIMNLHNNEAGRRWLRKSMNLSCKCHGVSGSCTMKVCWRVLAPFRDVGQRIRDKFEGAFQVKAVTRSFNKNKNGKSKRLRLKPLYKGMKRPSKKDLVFLDESPTYCDRNETIGVFGTRGRVCNQTSVGPDGCRLLCCGRGYQTMIREGVEKCNCQFVWCCRVECERCNYRREEHICN